MIRFTPVACAALLTIACGGDDGSTTAAETSPTSGVETSAGTSSTSATTTASTTDSTTAGTMSGSESGGSSSGAGSSGATTAATSEGSSGGSGTSGADSGSSDTGMACTPVQGSCVEVPCCEGLDCCEGQPIPPGEAVCYQVCPISDRNVKHDFAAVDSQALLETLATVPITTWRYREQDRDARHIGPMAQDFQAAFGVGGSDKAIFQVDADGVALAAIQALHARVETLQADNDALQATLARMQARLDALERPR